MITRIIVGVLAFIAAMFVGWYGGIDLMQRGSDQSYTLVFAIVCGGFAAGFPGLGETK